MLNLFTLRLCKSVKGEVVPLHALKVYVGAVAYPGIFFEGVQQIQLRRYDRENGDLGAVATLVRGSGGSCNLVQGISFHIIKFS